MAEKIKIERSLLEQLLDDIIFEKLVPVYELSFTDFEYSFTKFDFYLKATDLLRPLNCYLIKDNYKFNSYVFLRLNIDSVNYYASLGKEQLSQYILEQLKLSKEYDNYINRLGS
jgi:hypothetical protein